MGIAGYCGVVLDKASETPVSKGYDEPPAPPTTGIPKEVAEVPFAREWTPPVDEKIKPPVPARPD
jgi:hypothetical protein